MVEDLADVPAVEQEVSVRKVHERDDPDEDQQPGVVSLTRGLKRIVTDLVTVREIVDVVFFLPGVGACVRGERVLMATGSITGQQGSRERRLNAGELTSREAGRCGGGTDC